jgi:type IV secretory pathway TraG/TraD family ATPase VirD4
MREPSSAVRVLGILDEFKAAIGKLGVVESCMGLGAGYGIQLLNVFQNLSQLQDLWPHGWETFLANSGFQAYFAPRDKTTRDYLSDMCGETTVSALSKSMSEKPNGEYGVNLSYAQQGRRYLMPHEVRELPADEMLILGQNVPGVIRAGRCPYYASPEFKGCTDPDPYHFGEQQEKKRGWWW